MMGAGSATVTTEGKCVPSSPARCLPVATPPFVLDSAARPAQVKKAGCHLVVHHHLQPCEALYPPMTLGEEWGLSSGHFLSYLWLLLLIVTE